MTNEQYQTIIKSLCDALSEVITDNNQLRTHNAELRARLLKLDEVPSILRFTLGD